MFVNIIIRNLISFKNMLALIIMLTYDIIIKHLMPEINNFSIKPSFVMNSNEFQNFSSLFDDTFYRFGVDSNNSLINSIKISDSLLVTN